MGSVAQIGRFCANLEVFEEYRKVISKNLFVFRRDLYLKN